MRLLAATAILFACSFFLAPPPARANCLLCSCSVSTTTLAFGTYDQTSPSDRTANATVTVQCSSIASVLGSADIAISAGNSGNAANRRMNSGASTLSYNVFTSTAYTTVWGNGSGGTAIVQVPLNGIISFGATATAYGRIPASQNVAVGSYSDTLIVTITY